MTIIEELEKEHGIKIKQIKTTYYNEMLDITEKDLVIINSHKFEIKETGNFDNNCITIKCKICKIEADVVNNIIHCFYDDNIRRYKYVSCSKIAVERACE